MKSYNVLWCSEDLCNIASFSKFHSYYFFLVVQIFSLGTPYFKVDQVVQVLANFIEVDVWCIDFDLKSEDPCAQSSDSIDYLGSLFLVGLAVLDHFFNVLLQVGYLIAEPVVLQFHRMWHFLILLATSLPVFFLANVWSCDKDTIFILPAVFDGFLYDLG